MRARGGLNAPPGVLVGAPRVAFTRGVFGSSESHRRDGVVLKPSLGPASRRRVPHPSFFKGADLGPSSRLQQR